MCMVEALKELNPAFVAQLSRKRISIDQIWRVLLPQCSVHAHVDAFMPEPHLLRRKNAWAMMRTTNTLKMSTMVLFPLQG